MDPRSEPRFHWFGLPEKAEDSRWWALLGLILMQFIMVIIYLFVNEIAAARGVTVFDPARLFVFDGRTLDSRIPYLPWTVVIYHHFYKAFFLLAVLTYPKTRAGARKFFQLCSGVIGVTLAACVVFLLCPAEMTLRVGAEYQGDSPAMHGLNRALHVFDRPFNTWPCLHVAQTGLILLVVTGWLRRRPWIVLLWVVWTVMAISTLTTKQHYIWDLITGLPLALAYWQWKLREPSKGSEYGVS